MTPSKPLALFGTEDFSAVILRRLIEAGYDIKAVITKPDTPRGRGKTLQPPLVKQLAVEHDIQALQPQKLSAAISQIQALGCEHAILVAYGKIIPKSVLDIFPGGIINVHPSLLPQYRGPSPIESAILNGDKTTGISLIKLVEAMDAGPMYAQVGYELSGTETRPELYDTLATVGADLLLEHLPAILGGSLGPAPQNDNEATYCSLITKQDGVIDWNKPAARLERETRAYLGWPGSRSQLFDQDITILEASISDAALAPGKTNISDGKLLVGTASQSLQITKLRPSGRSSMDASDFLRGLRA